MLPPVFATYNPTTQTFQLFQQDIVLNKLVGIKKWSRPVKSCWKFYNSEKKKEMLPWLYGDQWYVIETSPEDQIHTHAIRINKRTYWYWHLNHTLVWADIIPPKDLAMPNIWIHYPHIPVLEFYTKSVCPSNQTEIVPNWIRTNSVRVCEESIKGYDRCKEYLYPCASPLRIRTPLPSLMEEDETESDKEKESDTTTTTTIYEKIHYCITILVIGFILYTKCL